MRTNPTEERDNSGTWDMSKSGPRPCRLGLSTITSSRRSLARLIRQYHTGKLDGSRAKVYAYLLSNLLAFFKLETDLRIEERIETIERRLQEMGR